MITAIQLKDNKTVYDLKLGEIYTATYKEGTLFLTKNIRTRISKPLTDLATYPVRVTKIIPPDSLWVDLINGEFTVKEDTEIKATPDDDVRSMVLKKSLPRRTTFTWNHPVLEQMKDRFIEAATIIRSAISTKTPIIIRHHADCDGYASGINLERAILPLIQKEYAEHSYRYYSKNPSKSPYYDYADALRDMEYALGNKRKWGAKTPLIILSDLGSGEENRITVSMAKKLGAKILVVDHHDPGPKTDGKTIMCTIADVHLNPFLFGSDSRFPAGTLTYELAQFINEDFTGFSLAPAIAAVGDKADLYEKEIFNHYTGLAKGYDLASLLQLARIIDYQALAARFLDISTIMDILYGSDPAIQKELVALLYPEMERIIEEFKNVIKRYAEVREFKNFNVTIIDTEACSFRGEYPSPSKLVGITHEHFMTPDKGQITIGKMGSLLIFRCDRVKNFDVHAIITKTLHELPFSLAEGGGHAAAGSMSFIAASQKDVIDLVLTYLDDIDSSN